jgi:histidinol-phosphate aminotransferase
VKKKPLLRGIRRRVLSVPAYTLRAYEAEIKLNQNESPFDFPADLKEEVFRRFRERAWSRYPEFVPTSIRKRLARLAGWYEEGILVGNGSNELLQAVLMVLVGGGTSIAIPSPTFTVYGLVGQILGGRIVSAPLKSNMSFDVDALLSKAEIFGSKLIIIGTPNNPTGSILPESDLERILDEFHGYVLLDEAYFEFCGVSGIKYLESNPRIVITRTFSKAMGMASLRIGYLMAHPDFVAQIAKAKLPYSVNQFSLTAAEVALDNIDRFQIAMAAIIEERDRLGKALTEVPGVRVFPSGGNFFLFEVPAAPGDIFEKLCHRGILIRDVSSYPMLSRCLRVSVGTKKENDCFVSALRRTLS